MTSGGETTRGETTRGNVLGAKRLGEEMVWGRNDPDSPGRPGCCCCKSLLF